MSTKTRARIVFVIGSLAGGGAERVFVTLLRHLDRKHFELHLVLWRPEGEFIDNIPDDVVTHTLGAISQRRSLPSLLVMICILVRLLWTIRPRVVFSTGGMNLALAAVRPLLPRDTRLLIRECSVLSIRLQTDTRFPHWWRWVYRHFYRCADNVVCQSESMVKDMTAQFYLPERKLVRIYNPIDIDLVRRLGAGSANPYCGSGPQLVAAGRLSNEKGFDLLLAAMPKIIGVMPNTRLTILGHGPLKSVLTQQAEKLGLRESVNFLDFQQNPWPYLHHADLFVLSSRRESFCNVLLETLTLETPAVAVDCPGAIREIYGDNPAVRIVPPGDSIVLAEAIIEMCLTRRRKGSDFNTTSDWLSKFGLAKIISEYSALFLR